MTETLYVFEDDCSPTLGEQLDALTAASNSWDQILIERPTRRAVKSRSAKRRRDIDEVAPAITNRTGVPIDKVIRVISLYHKERGKLYAQQAVNISS
ncbi:hypothetical protein [Dongshaea marina]|uniref:hypothetical protein n=1 Tax=Dongshaea marina TaxID=2047966 RepID=UPI000D3E689C|nr:hypothetical protein [Dongshaea marina]